MQDFLNKKILIGVCGSIAAYKTALLIRELTRAGAVVRVVMTESAKAFVSPLSFQALSGHQVRSERFDPEAEGAMGHIELARWADYFLIAPATANTLAKMAQGISDDLLTTLYLVMKKPVMVCPAMNINMWTHPTTQRNCKILIEHGVFIAGPDEGSQACGDEGLGRMLEPEHIINRLRLIDVTPCLKGRRVLITAGPTREAIDPVRYISNHSSGKMGYALAQAALMAGAEVHLISGPVQLPAPVGVKFTGVESAQEMHEEVMKHLQDQVIFIAAAAVGDYRCTQTASEKLKKQGSETLSLELSMNPDILAEVSASGKPLLTVGFAAETHNLLDYARQKMEKKKVDMIIANQVGPGMGFHTEDNEVTIMTKTKNLTLPRDHKYRLAGKLIAIIAGSLQNVG